MRKFLFVLFIVAMFATIYYNEKKKYSVDHNIYTIAYVYGERDDFISRAKKSSKNVAVNENGGVDLTLNNHQLKAWRKSLKLSLEGDTRIIRQSHAGNSVTIDQEYKTVRIRAHSEDLSTVAVYLPRMVFSCEIMQALSHEDGRVQVHIENSDNHKVTDDTYPGGDFSVTRLL